MIASLLLAGFLRPANALTLEGIDAFHKRNHTVEEFLREEQMLLQVERTLPKTDGLLWRKARVHYILGNRIASEEKKKTYFKDCVDEAEEVLRLNPNSAEGFLFRGICNGKLGQLQGIWASLHMIGPLRRDMEAAIQNDPSVFKGAPHRALGKLYYHLPFILGGDNRKAVEHYQEAIRYGPEYEDNYLFLAEAYFAMDEYRLAKEALLKVLELIDRSGNIQSKRDIRREATDLLNRVKRYMEAE